MEILEDVTKLNYENSSLWITLSSNLGALESNFKQFVESLETQNREPREKIDRLQSELLKLNDNVKSTFNPFWQEIKNQMFDLKTELKKRDQLLEEYQVKSRSRKESFKKLQTEFKTLQNVLYNQSTFITSLGSTLSCLLWKVSKEPHIIHDMIAWNKFALFFNTVTKSLQAYFATYTESLPNAESDETQFVIASVGIITNVAAVQEGRHFILTCVEGQEVILEILKVVTKIPSSDIGIQRIMLMALFNVSIHNDGTKLIESEQTLMRLLVYNISNQQNDLKFISLKLLQSITHDIRSEMLISSLLNAVSIQKLREIEENNSPDIKNMIKGIRERIQLAIKNIH